MTNEEWKKKMQPQKDEFDAVRALAKAYDQLPPIVADDYPSSRRSYEVAVGKLIEAFRANGRIKP